MNWNLRFDKGGSEVWLYNVTEANQRGDFVARFKYRKPMINARAFAKFLSANFTPAEYAAAYAADGAPLRILKSKGYVSPNERYVAEALAARAAVFCG
jgi:hypothetical protein